MGPTKDRTCARCGKAFKGHQQCCSGCLATERACDQCGKSFKGTHRCCPTCRATERSCEGCERVFKGHTRKCRACQRTERTCGSCGKSFTGTALRCSACRATERTCEVCGRKFKGSQRRCTSCHATDRTCEVCGKTFTGTNLRCRACQRIQRACKSCGNTFTGSERNCPACRAAERACEVCGRTFTGTALRCGPCWWESLPPEVRQSRMASYNHARRARKVAAEVAGPVPPEVYEAIRTSGPCAYCTAPATTVDHVRPLARGGWEHENNLVPACAACNFSKNVRLLTEWGRADRVAYGVKHSPKVAAEYARLMSATAEATSAPALGQTDTR
jgi:hypothetical protein